MKNRERFRGKKRNERNNEKRFINCFILAFCSSDSGLFRNWVWNFYIINNRMREILVRGITKLFKNQYSTAPINMHFIDEYWFDKLQYYHWILTVANEYRWFKYPPNDENVRSYLSKISNVQHRASKNFCRDVSKYRAENLYNHTVIKITINPPPKLLIFSTMIFAYYLGACVLNIEYRISNIKYTYTYTNTRGCITTRHSILSAIDDYRFPRLRCSLVECCCFLTRPYQTASVWYSGGFVNFMQTVVIITLIITLTIAIFKYSVLLHSISSIVLSIE